MAQKKLHKTIRADDIALIQVEATNCFELNVHTLPGKEVLVEAEMEGEYSKDLDIDITTNGNTMLIEAIFNPGFENPNDKLSAHKVVSILLNITIPHSKDVEIYGTNTNVLIGGIYNELQVSLADGTCMLNNVHGNAQVKTQSGNIAILANAAEIQAESKYGKVEFNPIPVGKTNYKLQTVSGNIQLSKTE